MTYPAKIAANRTNSRPSTGARTDAGNAVVARNSVRRGVLASVIPPKTQRFQETLLELYRGLKPLNEKQRGLANQIAVTQFRLRTLPAAELRIFAKPPPDADGTPPQP